MTSGNSDQIARDFWAWFDQTRGELSVRQIERRAKVPRNRISSVYTVKRQPTTLTCLAIAAGLGLDTGDVLAQAHISDPDFHRLPSQGLIKDSLTDLLQAHSGLAEIVPVFRKLSPDRQRMAIHFVKWLLDQQKGIGEDRQEDLCIVTI